MSPPRARYAPPPYSCTRVRALNGSAIISLVRPPRRRTITLRPPSDGRPSIQYVSAPSRCGLEKLTLLATILSVVIGERHSPYSAVVRPRVGLLINETPEMRVRPGTHSLGWLVDIRQEMTFAKAHRGSRANAGLQLLQ